MEKSPRIVFMGTPDFAVETLSAIIKADYNIVGVITSPDKPAGRGKKIQESTVKKCALENKLEVLQPTNLKDPDFIEELRSLKADMQIVVAFRMLPEIVWSMPAIGTINLHASLLPDYRGAAPINWAIINGEKETGISTFFIQKEIDTGNILFREKVQISDTMQAGELHDVLMVSGANLMVKTIDSVVSKTIEPINQDDILKGREPKLAPKIFKEDCKIDWNKPGYKIYNLIRGLSPYPAARTTMEFSDGTRSILKIFEAEFKTEKHNLNQGSFSSDGKSFLEIVCSDGFLSIKSLQIAGKKRMSIEDFLRGFYAINRLRSFI